ncbi:uncharacterized protein LOC119604106 isoform X2 [Lucilia sericata]|uniref:uncharacterized protein LOC119604106 isoform X2 n=1 Tax=Lucilia sericata TaxID=13632 RepID=UPI0018A865A2|nr:uncharacterized protein LOC119604106 isoform X2 [Lucilia sericata]
MAHDQNDPPPSNTVTRAIRAANSTRTPVILGADANAHHTIWGSSNINTRGITKGPKGPTCASIAA